MAMKKTILATSVKPQENGGIKWGVMVRDEKGDAIWVSTWNTELGAVVESLKRHDVVELEFVQSGQWFNIVSIEKIETPKEETPMSKKETPVVDMPGLKEMATCSVSDEMILSKLDRLFEVFKRGKEDGIKRDASIIAQSSLKEAIDTVQLIATNDLALDKIINYIFETAQKYFDWVYKKTQEKIEGDK